MNDEFVMSKTVVVGSSGSKEMGYSLSSEKLNAELNGLLLDEIERLATFLTEYVKAEKGGQNE